MKSKRLLLMLLMALLVPWAANAQETLTVHNGTSTNSFVPFYGYYSDESQTNQMIYPAAELADMAGGEITAMMFYWTEGQYYQYGTNVGNWTISIGETSATTLSGLDNTTTLTQVFSGYLPDLIDATNHILPITFANAYSYEGENLLVQFSHAASGYKDYAFYGETVTGASYCYNSQRNFLPKTTFTYTPVSTGCPNPKTFVASNVTAHGATMTWTMEDETGNYQFNLEYKKTTEETWTRIGLGNTRSYPLTGLVAETEYQVRIQTACEPENTYWKNLNPNIITDVACPAPTNLDVTDGSITAHEATVTWTGTSESYVVMIGQENLAIRADFEDQAIPADFTSTTDYPFTVVENTHSGAYCAKSGNGGVDESTSDMVLEVTLSADMTLTFSAKVSSESGWDKAYFSIDGVDKINAISGDGNWIDYSYPLTAGTHTLRWYYEKDGSNASYDDCFYVDDIVITAGVASWTEYTTTNQTYPFNNLTPNRSYLVKVKGNCGDEGYSQETTPVSFTTLESCPAPTGLAIVEGYPTAHGVSFTWNYEEGEVFQFSLPIGNVTDPEMVTWNTTWYAGENFPIYDNQPADADRTFWLRKKCGDSDFSDPVSITFHFLEACPAPTGFAVMPNSITAHTANLTWQGTSNSYQVAYRTTAYVDGIEEGFSSNPAGWENKTGLLSDIMAGEEFGTSTQWVFGTNNGVFDNHARINIYGDSRYGWLITPEMTLPQGATFSFDLALTAFSGTGAASGTCADDRFIVLVYADNAWHILREWNNADGSQYVYNNIPTAGMTVNDIDISAYVGKTVKFAFYGESTTTGNGDNNMHIDNVAIGTPVPAGEWQYMTEVTEVPCQLTGLLAERKYEATLQGDCGNEGPSTVVGPITFKTTIACPAPTALNHANVKSNQADLSWTNGGAENWVVAYKKTADENFTELNIETANVTIEGTTVTYTLTGLDEETAYTVKVRDNCEASIPGDGMSAWTATTSFTTMAACAVENVTVGNIGHYTATVNWDGESNKGFTVKYRTAAGIDGFNEEFGTSIPTEWQNMTGLLSDVMDGTAVLASGSQWSFGNSNNTFDHHARINIYGTSRKGWLITPEMTLPSGSTFSFDLALNDYNYSTPTIHNGTCDDDRFVVLVYSDNAWHILREWNNTGSADVYNDIAISGETVMVDVSGYVGKTVKFAFYGESTVSGNGDNNLHIDNVAIGSPVPAGTETSIDATDSPANLETLEAGKKYEVKVVPNCDESLASDWVSFTTVSADEKWFITEGNWGSAANWEPEGVPTIEQTVELRANATIESGCVAEAKSISGTGTGDNAKTLTIEDGGQLMHNSSGVRATVKKNITGYGAENINTKDGYYFISNPLTTTLSTTSTPTIASTGILTGTFDFYNWSNSNVGAEWRNYEATGGTFNMTTGLYGYLYANENDVELTFTGTIRQSNSYQNRYLYDYSSNYVFGAFWLLGNPFVCDAYLVNAGTNGTALPYYRMNAEGNGYEAVTGGAIAPMEGVFYDVTENGGNTGTASVYMVRTAPVAKQGGSLNMMVSEGRSIKDNAIIRFDEGQQLSKMSFREGSSKIYMPVEGKDFAIVSAGNVGEMPVSFKAEKNGSYNLSFTCQEVSFSYLHLIDNMTGNDVDLLANPSYSFSAQTTDYASRFRLVFATGSSVDGDNFGFINGMGNLCIFGIDGTATVQVVDVTGRMLSSETFSGSYERKLNVAPGVYMIRLINGNDVKVQKMIVR